MIIVESNGKQYEMVKRLSYGEGLEIEEFLGEVLDVDTLLKSGRPEDVDKILASVKSIRPQKKKLILQTLKKCLNKSEEEIKSLDYVDVILLFNAVWKANSEVPTPLESKSQ